MLGPLRVQQQGGAAVAPRGERPREVLALLCTRLGRPLPSEVILDLVWERAATSLSTAVVHTVTGRLRRQFGPGLVHTTDAGYLVPTGTDVDAGRFSELAAATRETSLEDRPTEREALCRQALALWAGGVAYEGVREALVRPERVRLGELHRRVRSDLASCLLARGNPLDPTTPGATDAAAEALLIAQELLATNPIDEDAAVLCMRSAYRLGRQGEALRVFDTLRRTLRRELGIDPGPAAEAVHARVLAQDASLGEVRPHRLHQGLRLAAPLTPTVGRERETAAVLEALATGRRLVTVTGPGGVGKSRMLADVGAALSTDAQVRYVTLSAQDGQTAADLAAALAVPAGLPLAGGDTVTALVRSLRARDLVVLVDDAEWVTQAAAELASAVLAGAPRILLVVASREPLSVLGEHVVELAPLPVPDPADPLPAVRSSAAVRLLLQRLADRAALPDPDPVTWPEEQLRAVAEATRRVDGLPLALELLAGAAGATPVEDLADLLRAEHPFELRSAEQGREERHQSLRATIAWSVTRLDPVTRDVFAQLSVFTGPFSPAAARAVVGRAPAEIDRAVRSLAAHHLLAVQRVAGRVLLRLLRTVRELAREDLVSAGHAPAVAARHREWFAGLWRDAPLSDALIEHLGQHYEDYIEAMTGALGLGLDDLAADVATALCRRWLFIEARGPGLEWTATLLARPGITAQQRARLQIARGAFATCLDVTPREHEQLVSALAAGPRLDVPARAAARDHGLRDRRPRCRPAAPGPQPDARHRVGTASPARADRHPGRHRRRRRRPRRGRGRGPRVAGPDRCHDLRSASRHRRAQGRPGPTRRGPPRRSARPAGARRPAGHQPVRHRADCDDGHQRRMGRARAGPNRARSGVVHPGLGRSPADRGHGHHRRGIPRVELRLGPPRPRGGRRAPRPGRPAPRERRTSAPALPARPD